MADLARAMGVRESKLEAVPPLALGTSPVTLLEMVNAYGTMLPRRAATVRPCWSPALKTATARCWQTFAPPAPRAGHAPEAALTLRNAMRGVMDQGTGRASARRWACGPTWRAKPAPRKTTPMAGSFLCTRVLVAGAWVGFNDARITLRSDYWGQGAHSALPMVGDFHRPGAAQQGWWTAMRASRRPEYVALVGLAGHGVRRQMKAWWADHPSPQARPPAAAGAPCTASAGGARAAAIGAGRRVMKSPHHHCQCPAGPPRARHRIIWTTGCSSGRPGRSAEPEARLPTCWPTLLRFIGASSAGERSRCVAVASVLL